MEHGMMDRRMSDRMRLMPFMRAGAMMSVYLVGKKYGDKEMLKAYEKLERECEKTDIFAPK